MTRLVTFNALWLLSERDASARHLVFHPQKNILVGDNGTGKSRIVKHMVWALGCEPPKRAVSGFDSNTIAALEVSIGATRRTFLRQNRRRAVFDNDGSLLFATESGSRWAEYFSTEFNFPLKLQRHNDEGFGYAGPGYALLPFYIDQDGGWGLKWGSFYDLTQFVKWQTPVFASFTGLQTKEYIRERFRSEDAAQKLRLAKTQLKAQRDSYDRVVLMLPPESTVVDERRFIEQLRDIAAETQSLQETQTMARAGLLTLAQERQRKAGELRLALESEKELVEDLAYLAKFKDNEILTCPMCAQPHLTTFAARQTAAVEAQDLHEVAVRLQSDLERISGKEAALQETLNTAATQLRKLQTLLNQERDGTKVADVIAAKSRDTLRQAYDAAKRDLTTEIDELAEEKQEIDAELKNLTDKGREKRVKNFFGEELVSFAAMLDIDKAEINAKLKIGARPPGASGSYAPRAVLATHLALLATHRQSGPGCTFPFIVDTPQQSGQDPASLGRMLSAILDNSIGGQSLVATESIPLGWQHPNDCMVHRFDEKRRVLQKEEYRRGIAALGDMVVTMKAAVLSDASDELEVVEPTELSEPADDDDEDQDGSDV